MIQQMLVQEQIKQSQMFNQQSQQETLKQQQLEQLNTNLSSFIRQPTQARELGNSPLPYPHSPSMFAANLHSQALNFSKISNLQHVYSPSGISNPDSFTSVHAVMNHLPSVKAHVFWDYENCQIPRGMSGYKVVRNIKTFIRSKKAILADIFAIGNVERLSSSVRIELEGAGVILQNVSCGKPSAADITILTEITKFVFENRPPHIIVLISGDRDFSKILSWLENVQYQ
ncbi:hypothetical protein HK096_008343, partial [Nowakowskiella sp. JEL0078]